MFGNISSFWSNYHKWILDGLAVTLSIAGISIIIGIIGALFVGYFREVHISRNDNIAVKIIKQSIKYILDAYLMFFRFTPLIAQAFFFYFALFAGWNLPSLGFFNRSFIIGTTIISLNAIAFFSKSFEGGIKAVDINQYKAGRSLGLSHRRVFFTIIVPQAFKNVLPQASNEFVNAAKATSVLSLISAGDLMQKINDGNNNSYDFAAGYTIAIIIYFFICLVIVTILKCISLLVVKRRANE